MVFDSFVPFDRGTGKRKNFASVRFKTEREMDNTIKLFDGKVHEGRKLQVNKAKFGPEHRLLGSKGAGHSKQLFRKQLLNLSMFI